MILSPGSTLLTSRCLQMPTTGVATRSFQQSDPERTGQVTLLAPAKLPRIAILNNFV